MPHLSERKLENSKVLLTLESGPQQPAKQRDTEADFSSVPPMVERALVLARELRSINRHRNEPQKIQRSRYFRAYCTGRLHEVAVASETEDAAWVPALKSALHRCNLALIRECERSEVTEIIDLSLESLEKELQNLQQEVWELDRKKMENLKMLNPRHVAGAQASPGKQLVRVEIQSLGGAAFQVTCSLNETLLHLKQYICSSGGPLVRDQKLVWNRSDLRWIHQTRPEASVDSFSLFYLGILDGDSAMLYYVRYCSQCEGVCACTECHGDGMPNGCGSCGSIKKPCRVCKQACRCPQCHGDYMSQPLEHCNACGERNEGMYIAMEPSFV